MNTITPSLETELPQDSSTLLEMVQYYTTALASLQTAVDQALADIQANPSDPGALARFQAAQGDYTSFKTFLSTLIKSYRDLDQGIIRNIG